MMNNNNLDYKYGIFARISRSYDGPNSKYWTNRQVKLWMDMNDVAYKQTDKRVDLIERIKEAGYK